MSNHFKFFNVGATEDNTSTKFWTASLETQKGCLVINNTLITCVTLVCLDFELFTVTNDEVFSDEVRIGTDNRLS
jgi:hypothetical protein